MNIEEFNAYVQKIPEQINAVIPGIVAETAVIYYKNAFTIKGFDGNPWVAGKPERRGSLLVQSGNLQNSIRPSEVSPDRVVISAGNALTPYAQVHNEGFSGEVNIPVHIRKGSNVKAHTRRMNIPKRTFMAESEQLNNRIKEAIDGVLDTIL